MSEDTGLKSTQRAYTLRLQGSDESTKEALWQTHLAVNNGAKEFGDWLLTMRGGLSHTLVNETHRQDGCRQSHGRVKSHGRTFDATAGYDGILFARRVA